MRSILIFISVFWFIDTAQSTEIYENVLTKPPGYIIESLSGTGFSNAVGKAIFNLGNNNPALAADYKEISFGISNQFETNIKPFNFIDVQFKRCLPCLPQTASFILPYHGIAIGVGFSQKFNHRYDLGEITWSTVEWNGDVPVYKDVARVHEYSDYLLTKNSLSLAFPIPWMQMIDIGFRYNVFQVECKLKEDVLARYTPDYPLSRELFNEREYKSGWALGIVGNLYRFKTGLFFEQGLKTRLGSPNGYFPNGLGAAYPDQISWGASWSLTPRVTFTGNLSYSAWDKANRVIKPKMKNQFEYSGSIQTQVLNSLSITFGVLQTGFKTKDDSELNPRLAEGLFSPKIIYTLFGLVYNLKTVYLDFTLARAQYGMVNKEENALKKTILKIGLGYTP